MQAFSQILQIIYNKKITSNILLFMKNKKTKKQKRQIPQFVLGMKFLI